MAALQGTPRESTIRVLDGVGSPITGLTFEDFVVTYLKSGENTFLPKYLDVIRLYELQDGYYRITWLGSEMNNLGEFLFKVSSSGATAFDAFYQTFEINPNTISGLSSPDVCIVSGNIVDIVGHAAISTLISFNPVSGPITVGTSFLNSSVIETTPDAYGNFSIALLRNVQVRVILPTVGVNHKITVPDQETALLKDLLPIPI